MISSDYLGPLLHALAASLDVREIFARISAEARRIVPHDFLMLGLVSPDRQRVRVLAFSSDMPEAPEEIALDAATRGLLDRADAMVWNHAELRTGGAAYRAWLRLDGGDAGEWVEAPLTSS